MRQSIAFPLLFVAALAAPLTTPAASPPVSAALPPGVTHVTEIESVGEYRLSNGLRVLLFPDLSKDTITVNITYLVGSRHEGYGETGMAHLLEHMVFKGSPRHPDIPEESAVYLSGHPIAIRDDDPVIPRSRSRTSCWAAAS